MIENLPGEEPFDKIRSLGMGNIQHADPVDDNPFHLILRQDEPFSTVRALSRQKRQVLSSHAGRLTLDPFGLDRKIRAFQSVTLDYLSLLSAPSSFY